MATNIDFILKSGLQVAANVKVGSSYVENTALFAPVNGALIQGNVGIGTQESNHQLTVAGNVKLFNNGATLGGIVFPDGTWQDSAASASAAGNEGSIQFNDGFGYFTYDELFEWDTANNRLGVGTNVPAGTMHVVGPTPAIFDTVNAGEQTVILGNSASNGVTLGFNPNNNYGWLKPGVGGQDMLRWNTAGVAINGVTPLNKLDVSGGVAIGGIQYAGATLAPSNGMIVQGQVGIGTNNVAVNTTQVSIYGGNLQVGETGFGIIFQDGSFQNTAFNSSSAVTSFSAGTTGLTPNSATTGAITLAGTLAAGNGGTGQSSYSVGDILYASGSAALSKLASVGQGNVLITGGVGAAPSWGKVGLTTHVSGVLPLANGGTNNGSLAATAGGVVYGDGTKLEIIAAGVSGNVLLSGGAGAPTWGLSYSESAVPNSLVVRDANGDITANTVTANDGLTVTAGGYNVTGNSQLNGNLAITGNIILNGNVFTTNANVLVIENPLIYVGSDNPADSWDLGLVASYTEGTYQHTGLVRNATTNEWTFFDNLITEPTNTLDWAQAGLEYGDVTTGQLDVKSTINSTSPSSGALVVDGGAGVANDLWVGGNVNIGGSLSIPNASITASNLVVTNLTVSQTTTTNALVSNSSITSQTGDFSSTVVIGGATTVNSLTSNGSVSGTSFTGTTGDFSSTMTIGGATTVNSLTSNGAVSGTSFTGTTGDFSSSVTIGGATTVNSLSSNGAVTGTTAQFSSTATVNSLVSNGAVSGTTFTGTTGDFSGSMTIGGATTVNSLSSNGAVTGTTAQFSSTATVNSLISNGTVSGTTFTGTTGDFSGSMTIGGATTVNSLTSNGAVTGTTAQFSSTATVNSLVSNGTVSGTTFSGTAATFTGSATASSITSNTTVSGNSFVIGGSVASTSLTSPLTVDSWPLASYRTVHYIAQVTDNTNAGDFQACQFMILHDGTTAFKSEYNIMFTNGNLGSFDAVVSGTDINVTFTAVASTNKTIKVTRTGVTV